MDSHSKLMAELMQVYLLELSEHVATLNRDLLELEKSKDRAERKTLLDNLFRAAHSLKSASAAVDMRSIEAACHKLEDIMVLVRDGVLEFTPALTTLILRSADRIEEAGMQLREEQPVDDSTFKDLLPLLEQAKNKAIPTEEQIEAQLRTELRTQPPATAASGPRNADTENADTGNGSDASDRSSTRRVKKPLASSVRVAAEKLDALMAHSGELLVARRRVESRSSDIATARDLIARWHDEWQVLEPGLREMLHRNESSQYRQAAMVRKANAFLHSSHERFTELERKLDRLATSMTGDTRNLGQVCDSLEEEVLRVRMLPFAEACGGLERAVRDAAVATKKEVELQLVGQEVEVDRSVLEALKDPLLHLVRNAVDHGLESPDARQAAGKPRQGRITVSAALRGGQVEVTVADDGSGLNLDRIREKLAKRGLHQPHDEQELARSVFMPGFSTAAIVTDISGRGVGLDVVQAQIESLHGNVDIQFEPGGGTEFKLVVPLTLTTVRSVLARCGQHVYVLPTVSVDQFIRFHEDEVGTIAGREVLLRKHHIQKQEAPIPIVPLGEVLGLATESPPSPDGTRLAVVICSGSLRVGVIVDEVLAEQEITLKGLGPRVGRLKHISGATLLPAGKIALVLNVATLVRSALAIESTGIRAPSEVVESVGQGRLLVVDDSVTTRSLIKSILETAGYEVRVAVDGRQAMDLLESETFDVVVSDVDMPRMNGFELTRAIRRARGLKHVPIVLVTARSTEEDRARGVEAGANAYITKSGFEQSKLLETVAMML